jgi:hypothetical protein
MPRPGLLRSLTFFPTAARKLAAPGLEAARLDHLRQVGTPKDHLRDSLSAHTLQDSLSAPARVDPLTITPRKTTGSRPDLIQGALSGRTLDSMQAWAQTASGSGMADVDLKSGGDLVVGPTLK